MRTVFNIKFRVNHKYALAPNCAPNCVELWIRTAVVCSIAWRPASPFFLATFPPHNVVAPCQSMAAVAQPHWPKKCKNCLGKQEGTKGNNPTCREKFLISLAG